MWKHVEIDSSPERKPDQPLWGAKHFTRILVCIFPKWGLDDAKTDRFAKQNDIETTKRCQKNKTYNKDQTKKAKKHSTYQVVISWGNPCKQVLSQSTAGRNLQEQNF